MTTTIPTDAARLRAPVEFVREQGTDALLSLLMPGLDALELRALAERCRFSHAALLVFPRHRTHCAPIWPAAGWPPAPLRSPASWSASGWPRATGGLPPDSTSRSRVHLCSDPTGSSARSRCSR